jgi:hypothetical protein
MFESTSRYFLLPDATLIYPSGRVLRYKRRRFLPPGSALPLLVELTLEQDQRLDNATARVLGNPEQFWRVCDANDAMNPFDLEIDKTRLLRVPIPQP